MHKSFSSFFLEIFKKKKRTAAATPIVSAASPFRSLSTVASVFFLLVFRRFFFRHCPQWKRFQPISYAGRRGHFYLVFRFPACFLSFFFFVELFNRVFFPGFELFLHQVSRRLLLGFTEFFPGYRLNGVFPRNKRKTGQWSCCFFCFSIATKNQAVGLVRCFFVFFCFFFIFPLESPRCALEFPSGTPPHLSLHTPSPLKKEADFEAIGI